MIFVPFSLKMLHFLNFFINPFIHTSICTKKDGHVHIVWGGGGGGGWGGGSVAPSLLSLFFFAMVYIMYMLIITHSSNSSIHR